MNNLLIIGISLLLLFSGCKKAPEDKVMPPSKEVSPTTAPVETPYTITLSPSSPDKRGQIAAKIQGVSPRKLRYQWIVNDSEVEKANAPVFQSDSLKKGDRIKVRISVEGEDKTYISDEVIIANTPPQIQSARLVPANPQKGDNLKVEVKTVDEDKDPVNFSYEWFINGKPTGNTSEAIAIDKTLFKTGDKISVKITPTDRETNGISVTLSSFIANSPPNVSPNIAASFNGLVYTSKVMAEDPEGDPLTYTLREGPQGMTIDSKSGIITWEVKPENKGEHNIVVSVSDGHGGETIVPFTARISFAPPSAGK